jgi:hypothetical protein
VIPLKRFLDPFLFLGLFLLFVYKYSGIWLNDNPVDQNWRAIIAGANDSAGIGGAMSLLVGIVRPVATAMLQGQFLAAIFFSVALWFVLALPGLYLSFATGHSTVGQLYWVCLLIVFLFTNVLIGISFLTGWLFPKKN